MFIVSRKADIKKVMSRLTEINIKMSKILMNSGNSKTSDALWLSFNLRNKMDYLRGEKRDVLSGLCIYYMEEYKKVI